MSIIIKGGTSNDLASVKPASTPAAATDPALVVTISPNTGSLPIGGSVSVSNFPATQPVSGTLTANIGTTNGLALDTSVNTLLKPASTLAAVTTLGSITSAVTVSQATAANLNATVVGVVTANAGTNLNTSALALDSSVNGISLLQGAATTGQKGVLHMGAVTTASPTYGTGTTSALSLTTAGALRVDASATSQPISGTVLVSSIAAALPTGANTIGAISNTSFIATQTTGTNLHTVVDSGAVTANIGTTNGLALDTSVNLLLKPASTLAAVTAITNTVTVKADTPANQTNALKVDGSAVTQPISAASLPLPTNASTSGLQSTGNGSLSSIDSKTPFLGITVSASSQPVVLASDSAAVPVQMAADKVASGSLTALNSTVIAATNGSGTAVVQLSGTWVGTVTFEGSNDNFATSQGIVAVSLSALAPFSATATINGFYSVISAGFAKVQARMSSYTSGTAVTAFNVSAGNRISVALQGNPANLLMTATQGPAGTGAWKVDGSGVTQPVSGTVVVSTLPSIPTGANTIGAISNTSFIATQTTGSNLHTVIDSGTVTANQGAAPWSENVTQYGGFAISTGVGASGTGIPRVTVANDSNILATQSGTWNISNISGTVSLPTGAATSALQSTGNSSLASIASASGTVAAGTAGTTSFLAGNVFNTTLPTLSSGQQAASQADSNGRMIVTNSPIDGAKTTYSTSATVVPTTAATDIFTITGSATKTIRVLKVKVSGVATTAQTISVFLLKRSTANSAGTSTAPQLVPHDSNSAAPTATVLGYTANPTTGTLVGNLRQDRFTFNLSTNTAQPPLVLDFGDRPGQAVVLRGVAQVLAFNLGGVSLAGGSVSLSIEWTEE